MKLRYIIIAWVCYCGFLPILELHGAAAAAAGVPEPATAGGAGGGAPVRSFPLYVPVSSLEFMDGAGYRSNYRSDWVEAWHTEKQGRIKALYDELSDTERFPMPDPDDCVPNIACARLSLIYTEPLAVGASSPAIKVAHYDARSSPAAGGAGGAAGGAGAPVTDLLFLSGLGWGRWEDSTAVQSYISEQGFEGITMDPYLPVDEHYVPKKKHLQHRMMCLQLKDFFAGSAWSRLPALRRIQDDIDTMNSHIYWVDKRDFRDEGGILDEGAFKAALKEPNKEQGTLGQRFFDSEQVILRYFLEVSQDGSVVRELTGGTPQNATLQRVVLNIASYKIPCPWCSKTYYWEAESKSLIVTALIESLSILRPDIRIAPSARRLFVEFSGRMDREYGTVTPGSLHINNIWPCPAAKRIVDPKPEVGPRLSTVGAEKKTKSRVGR